MGYSSITSGSCLAGSLVLVLVWVYAISAVVDLENVLNDVLADRLVAISET